MENQLYICLKSPENGDFKPLFSVPFNSCTAFGGNVFQSLEEMSQPVARESVIEKPVVNFSKDVDKTSMRAAVMKEYPECSSRMLDKFKKFQNNKRF